MTPCFSTRLEENMAIKHVKDSCDMNFMKTFHSTLDRPYGHCIFYILPVSGDTAIHLIQEKVQTSYLMTLLHPFRQRQGSEMIVSTHLTTHVFHKKSANKERKIHNRISSFLFDWLISVKNLNSTDRNSYFHLCS